jgi:hypothetical protein
MWSLTPKRAKRISGPKKFRPSGEKDFFNTIPSRADIVRPPQFVGFVPGADVTH